MGAAFRILGYGVVLFAAGKLNKYNRTFRFLQFAALLMITVSLLLGCSDIWEFLYDQLIFSTNPFGERFTSIMGYVEMFASLIFNAIMLYAIRAIAVETEDTKIMTGATRNFVFICIYYILYFIGVLPFDFAKEYAKYFSASVLILYFVWIILNLILIFSCYARICDENDVDMPRKPSRFEFVNKMRAEFDERQQKADQRQAEYRQKKQEKRKNRRR
jgi:hypothetical protein